MECGLLLNNVAHALKKQENMSRENRGEKVDVSCF